MPDEGIQEAQAEEKTPAGFSPITSQEELDRILKHRLKRAEESFRKDNQDAFDKAKAYDDLMGRSTELQAELDALKKSSQVAEWMQQAAKDTGVPVEVLRGETEEEIRAHAESLKPHFEKKRGYVGSDGFAASSAPLSTRDQFARALENTL